MTKLIFLILCVLFLSGCSGERKADAPSISDDDATASDSALNDAAQQKMSTFSLSGTEKGLKKWDIEGEKADLLSSDVVQLSKVKGKSYGEDNVVTVTAEKGKLDQKTKDMELSKNVVAVTEDGARLTTERLNWNAGEERVWTKEFVEIEKDDIKASGAGISGHPNLEKMKFEQDVKIEIAPATIITCDGTLRINYKENVAYLNDNVCVKDERGELMADKARVFFDKDEKAIKKVIAEGNVKIKRGENITYSSEAIYYADEGRVVLKGRPKLVIYTMDEIKDKDGVNTNKKSDKGL
ncbi:MAG: LPS export ABC transporter periplasmic protein LptC [Candidatus Omnitrophica bacterium]|nr:LPS export ABC transporter periplasmic protein LptC [Candidatus Omnitrophota bacterium]